MTQLNWYQRTAAFLTGASLLFALTTVCTAEGKADTPPKADHALGLTAEQRMEDYEYFWSVLRDSYPCWGVLEREGVDTETIYREYQSLIAENDSDVSFYSALYSSLWRLGQSGHLWIIEPESYVEMRDYTAAYEGTDREHWDEVLNSPQTVSGYEKLSAMMKLMGEDGDGWEGGPQTAANVNTLYLPKEGIAYLKIGSFAGDMAADKALIDGFYKNLAGYSDLIIDLTENSGGSELYWQNLLVAPLLDAPLQCENYALTRMSCNNTPYLEDVFLPEELRPISELPDLPALEETDRALATHFVRSILSVSPAVERAPFHGRVWLLVNDRVYSASESFAVFCQQTGFATLVGTRTGGDGIGALDPIFLQLPNSGLLVQFTAMFGLNPDGSSNEERGTTPDLPSPAVEHPLVTALRAIQSTP